MSVREVLFNFLKSSPEVGHNCECGVTIKEASGRFNLVSLDTTVPHAQVLNLEMRRKEYILFHFLLQFFMKICKKWMVKLR